MDVFLIVLAKLGYSIIYTVCFIICVFVAALLYLLLNTPLQAIYQFSGTISLFIIFCVSVSLFVSFVSNFVPMDGLYCFYNIYILASPYDYNFRVNKLV